VRCLTSSRGINADRVLGGKGTRPMTFPTKSTQYPDMPVKPHSPAGGRVPEMTKHPCEGMTWAQRSAFERIAVNQFPGCRWPTIDALLKAGVIERGEDDIRRDAMGVYHIPNFFVPLPIHAQWCEWCSEQEENGKCATSH
jgi:hypothetical protein